VLRRNRSKPDQLPTSADRGATAIVAAQPRVAVRVEGEVTRMRARPTTGVPALAVTISDATGSVVAVWTGRRSIGGLTLGRHVLLDGVAVRRGQVLEFTNPAYTLLP